MSTNPLPVDLYQILLAKLGNILQLTHQQDGVTTSAAKQTILQATNDFRNTLIQAKDRVTDLPGGELMIEEQEDVIRMLEALRDRKQALLDHFSEQPLQSFVSSATENKTGIDSMTSTPVY